MTAQDVIHCQRCGERLNPARIVWLDLNNQTLRYSRTEWPAEESQGAFPFGAACARAEVGR